MEPRPASLKSATHETLFISAVCMGQFLTQASITTSLSAMNVIQQSFEDLSGETSSAQTLWFMGSFALTVGTFILVSGRIGDLFGLKGAFLVGWWLSCFWSLMCGISYYTKSIVFFIICRAFQGVGFAFLLPCAMGILGRIYPIGARKNIAFGFVGACGPTGATIGALMAAVFAEKVWWPWAFWAMAIACGVLGVISFYVIPLENSPRSEFFNNWKKFDFIGSAVGVVCLLLFNFTWNQGPVDGWDSPYLIVLLVVSIALGISFFYIEKKVKYPLVPPEVINLQMGLVLFIISLGWGSFGIWQYYYWSFILNLREYSPIEGGLTYMPLLILGIIAALGSSIIITKVKPSYLLSFAAMCFTIGCVMLSVTSVDESYFQLTMGTMFILCWAMDISFPSAAIILSDYLPLHSQGMSGSLISTFINYSVSLFLGIASNVEHQVFIRSSNVLQSYRAALYFGTGIGGLSVLFSIYFIFCQHKESSKTTDEDSISIQPYDRD